MHIYSRIITLILRIRYVIARHLIALHPGPEGQLARRHRIPGHT